MANKNGVFLTKNQLTSRSNRKRFADIFCWTAIVVAAASLRVPAICAGFPYIDYIDEGYVLHQSIELLNHRSLDTRWYGYPSLPAYLTTATLITYSPIYRVVHGHGFRKDLPPEESIHTPQGDNYDLIAPPALIAAGRSAAITLSLGTVIMAGAIAASLAGKGVGLFSMSLTAISPALVSRASNVIVDTFATFFALLSLCFCGCMQRALGKNNYRALRSSAAFAGFSAGLALASKYTVAVVFAAVALTIIMLPTTKALRAWLVVMASGGFFLGGALAAPATLIKPSSVWREVLRTAHNYTTIVSSPGYFGQAVANSELGWPLVIAGCIGLVLMLRLKVTKSFALSSILFAAILTSLFIGKPFQPFRNLLPLVPLFCIAAAFALTQLLRWANAKRYRKLGYFGVSLLILGIISSLCYSSLEALQRRILHRDTRVQTIDWLQGHTKKSDRVLALAELGFLPSEWKRIDASVRIAPWSSALDLLRRNKFDYLISGEFDLRVGGERTTTAYQKIWTGAVSSFASRASFGYVATPLVPYFWRTNDERIFVLGIQPN